MGQSRQVDNVCANQRMKEEATSARHSGYCTKARWMEAARINNPNLEAEGIVEKAEGKAQEKVGQVKKVVGK